MQGFGLSIRKTCRIIGIERTSFKYNRKIKPDEEIIRKRLKELSQERMRFGYRRLHVMLCREGFVINHKRTQRIYRQENLMLRKKRRKKFASVLRPSRPEAVRINHVWCMDFIHDRLDNGRQLKSMTLVDEYSRKCLTIEADTSLPGIKVVQALERVSFKDGLPEIISVDNGPEFIGKALDSWAYQRGIKLSFITPGKPTENPYVESFHDKFRDECLNLHWFLTLEHARNIIEKWRIDYNCQRPHSSLKNLTPEEFLKQERIKQAQKIALKL